MQYLAALQYQVEIFYFYFKNNPQYKGRAFYRNVCIYYQYQVHLSPLLEMEVLLLGVQ